MRMLDSIVATRAPARSHRRAHTVAVTAIMGLRTVVAIAAAGIVVACGGSGSSGGAPSPTPLVEVGQLTVTGSGCTYQRSSDPAAGTQAAIRLIDQRATGFNAHLFLLDDGYRFLLDDGYRFSDWEAGFLVSHATLVEHAHRVADGHVDPSKTDSFSAQFVSGTYGILCVPLRNGQEYGIGYTAGPITVR